MTVLWWWLKIYVDALYGQKYVDIPVVWGCFSWFRRGPLVPDLNAASLNGILWHSMCSRAQSRVHKEMFFCPPVQSFRDELDHQLGVGSYRQASVPALANAHVAELEQIPAAWNQKSSSTLILACSIMTYGVRCPQHSAKIDTKCLMMIYFFYQVLFLYVCWYTESPYRSP